MAAVCTPRSMIAGCGLSDSPTLVDPACAVRRGHFGATMQAPRSGSTSAGTWPVCWTSTPGTLSGFALPAHNTALSYARVAIAVDGVAMADRVGLTLARRDASSATRCARGSSVATTGKYQPVIEVR